MGDPRDPLAEQYGAMDALEKIEWMIETKGWALEPVLARPQDDPPVAGYSYTIGVPAAVGFPEMAVFGLAPSAANGLFGAELVGLLDNELRCMFATIDLGTYGAHFPTASAWYGGEPFAIVQLLYPDRNGFLPYEVGFDARMRFAQPVIGDIDN
jgi:hypothetical protein